MTITSRLNPEIFGIIPNLSRRSSAWWAVLLLVVVALAVPVSAQGPPQSASLKEAVILMGANSANDALSIPVQPGLLDLDLYLQFKQMPNKQLQGKLLVTKFLAQTSPAHAVATSIHIVGTNSNSGDDVPFQVTLAATDLLHIKLTGSELRPGATYKGSLFLTTEGLSNRWEITLTTGALGTMAVDPVGTVKFITFHPCTWIPRIASFFDSHEPITGSFSVTLHDKSGGGPYHHVRVRFEASGTPASKATTSNFSLDTFSFWETRDGKLQKIDLEQREANAPAKVTDTDSHGIDLGYRGQRTLTARIKSLSPGEYSGALRFVADESSDDTLDAKLPLTIQVRHHWILPVMVILFGSLVGWFSSKYIVGVRKANELARQVKELRDRADDVARPSPLQTGWEFPSEANSYGLTLIIVQLSQLAKLASSGLPILVREEEIQKQRLDAELRLTALENLREIRLQVQPVASGRPAAQLALGRLLRCARDIIERPTFAQTQQTDFANLLQTAGAWLVQEIFLEKYREALTDRLNSQEIPSPGDMQSFHDGGLIGQQLMALRSYCPSKDVITKEADLDKLLDYDQKIAKIALLWRERKTPWAGALAAECKNVVPLDDLFRLVDQELWKTLESAGKTKQLKIDLDPTSQSRLLTYELLEFYLTSNIPDVSCTRIIRHPLHVGWRIISREGAVRSSESHDLTLVQYFPQPGNVTIKAFLSWQGREIPLNNSLQFDILPNPEYRKSRILSGEFTEWVVIAIAAGFAVATAMSTQYDSTFGSYSQYLTLFIWAAGAGTGGNIFKQLGTTSTPGGQPDVTLSKPTTAGGAAAGA